MYNINISLLTLNNESATLLFIYALAIAGIIYMATKKVKSKKLKIKKGIVYSQEEKFSVSNYTLDFENDEFDNVPAKRVSVITKGILAAFSIAFAVIPFYSFVETLNPVEIRMVMCCLC